MTPSDIWSVPIGPSESPIYGAYESDPTIGPPDQEGNSRNQAFHIIKIPPVGNSEENSTQFVLPAGNLPPLQ